MILLIIATSVIILTFVPKVWQILLLSMITLYIDQMWSLYKDPNGKKVFEEEEYNKGVSNMSTSQYNLMD